MARNCTIEAKQIFHRIWITGRKSLQVVKWVLCLCLAWPFVTKLLAKSSHAWYWNFPAFKDVINLVSKIVIPHLDQNDRYCCVYYCTFVNWGPGEFINLLLLNLIYEMWKWTCIFYHFTSLRSLVQVVESFLMDHKELFLNSLWPSDAIWRHRSGSTLAQVMACCLTATSHYLNQCWLVIIKGQWHSSDGYLSITVTTHLLSIECADWPKLHNMFKACDANVWQREFPVGFPVEISALNSIFIKIFPDVLLI